MKKPTTALALALLVFTSLACNFVTRAFDDPYREVIDPTAEAWITDEPPQSPNEPSHPGGSGASVYDTLSFTEAEIIYYNIYGSTAAELREQMNLLGPVDDTGYRGDAMARWYIEWRWPGYGTSDCDLSAATTSYTLTVEMPYWEPPADTDPALIKKWSEYMVILAGHEQGHIDNFFKYYPQALPAIQNATCDTAEQAVQAVLQQIRDADIAYDDETGHGATQGAVFP
jgi:predicted secreted Zn-dependent protease